MWSGQGLLFLVFFHFGKFGIDHVAIDRLLTLRLALGRSFLGLFANETAVIDAGMQRLRIMSFSYVVSPLMDASIAASRGIGKSVGPTVIVILGSCVFRVIWVYTVFAWLGTITSLYLLYIFSWTITGAAEIVYFRRSYKKVILSAQSW